MACAIFFNGQIRQPAAHASIAQSIGEYWKFNITEGAGTYHSSNAHSIRYENIGINGIGPIEFGDSHKIQLLKDMVTAYLCKIDLLVGVKNSKPFRKFRRAVAPVAVRRRPRKEVYKKMDCQEEEKDCGIC